MALTLPLAAEAALLSAGSAMPPLALNDQHDKPAPVCPETRWVVFASEKAVSDMVSTVLSAEPAGVVERLRLVYVADISGMPSLVTRPFALPKLRELSFPIALVREPGQVAQVAAASNAAELRLMLGLPPAKAAP